MATWMLAWSPFDPMHLLVIGIVALLLFGKRLPEVGRSLGRGIMEFKKGLKDVQEEMNRPETDRSGENKREPERLSESAAKRFPDPRPGEPAEQREGRPRWKETSESSPAEPK